MYLEKMSKSDQKLSKIGQKWVMKNKSDDKNQ